MQKWLGGRSFWKPQGVIVKTIIFLAVLFLIPANSALASDPLFDEAVNYGAGDYPYCVITGDFDEDGHIDLAVANAAGYVSILLGTGWGTFASAVNYGAGGEPHSVATGDFNEDEHADLAVANHASDNVSILLGAGDGTFGSAVNYGAGDGPDFVTTGDFDEDGHTDLVVANRDVDAIPDDNVSILLGAGV